MTLEECYGVCREIARREAKNFYWAFRVLPRDKSNGMCAIYAFMRRADDISDDERKPVEERRAEMSAWMESFLAGAEDPVFTAVRDAQKRWRIADKLLVELGQGTAMDLEERPEGVVQVQLADGTPLQAYATFAGLYRYCYLVASVVGLVCIRIFGYEDPSAEGLAEETGVAFQLTNILRDVQEDRERGRVYLPMDDMAGAGTTFEEIGRAAAGQGTSDGLRRLLEREGERAEAYYGAAERLLPMIDADSRAALWVMVTIYHELLRRVAASGYEVFGRRVRVPTWKKISILVRGLLMARRLKKAGAAAR